MTASYLINPQQTPKLQTKISKTLLFYKDIDDNRSHLPVVFADKKGQSVRCCELAPTHATNTALLYTHIEPT